MTWKQRARAVILAVMRQAALDGLDRAAMIKRIDAAYPFVVRKYYPYRAWLETKRSLLYDGQPTPAGRHYRPPSEAAKMRKDGQPELFSEES